MKTKDFSRNNLAQNSQVSANSQRQPPPKRRGIDAWLKWHKQRIAAENPDWQAEMWRLPTEDEVKRQEMALRQLVKLECRQATTRAVRLGEIKKGPCEVCGSLNVEAHHDDYDKPYQVRWLCFRHHHEHHGNKTKKDFIVKRNGYSKPPAARRPHA